MIHELNITNYPGLKEDMVDFLFGNVKDILLFEVIFQNDLEEAKEMIRQDSSFHVGVVFVEKALVSLNIIDIKIVSIRNQGLTLFPPEIIPYF